VVSIAAHPWHCSSMALGHSRSRSRQPCPWLTSAVLGVVGAVLSHTSSTIVGERLVYISMQCNQSKVVSFTSHSEFQAFGHCCCLCLCVLRAQLFFYLGAVEERREGEQVLLTWELGSRANSQECRLFHLSNDTHILWLCRVCNYKLNQFLLHNAMISSSHAYSRKKNDTQLYIYCSVNP
jgi:hypothetical protein